MKVALPEGTEVEVHIHESTTAIGSFANRFKDFIGATDDLPADLALNLNHYLHGHPKK